MDLGYVTSVLLYLAVFSWEGNRIEGRPTNATNALEDGTRGKIRQKRSFFKQGSQWPVTRILYKIEGFERYQADKIEASIDQISAPRTCLQLVRKDEKESIDEYHIVIRKRDLREEGVAALCGISECIGHKPSGGRCIKEEKSGFQYIYLDSENTNCNMQQVPAHEMLHALGFYHEHSRKDRPENFVLLYDGYTLSPFDPESIMLYPYNNTQLSRQDAEGVNKVYCS